MWHEWVAGSAIWTSPVYGFAAVWELAKGRRRRRRIEWMSEGVSECGWRLDSGHLTWPEMRRLQLSFKKKTFMVDSVGLFNSRENGNWMGRAGAAAKTHTCTQKDTELCRYSLMQKHMDIKTNKHAPMSIKSHFFTAPQTNEPHTCTKTCSHPLNLAHTHTYTDISKAGVLWLRGKQLEWRLQWRWWAVTIWRSTCLPASSASGINHLPNNWASVDQHVSLCHLVFTLVCVVYVATTPQMWCFPRLLQSHSQSIIVSSPEWTVRCSDQRSFDQALTPCLI